MAVDLGFLWRKGFVAATPATKFGLRGASAGRDLKRRRILTFKGNLGEPLDVIDHILSKLLLEQLQETRICKIDLPGTIAPSKDLPGGNFLCGKRDLFVGMLGEIVPLRR